MAEPTADDLAKVPVFASLSHDVRAALAPTFDVEAFAAGSDMVTEGRSGYAFYVLAQGQATVSHDGRQVRELGPGDYFGEMAILGDGRRTATVTATTPCRAWVLFGTMFRSLQMSQPEIAGELVQVMRDRLTAD